VDGVAGGDRGEAVAGRRACHREDHEPQRAGADECPCPRRGRRGARRRRDPAVGHDHDRLAVQSQDRSFEIPPPEFSYAPRRSTDTPILLADYTSIEGSTFARSTRIVDLLAHGRACIYAQVDNPAPPMEIPGPLNQRHLAFVRSVVPLD
jgi:hypothetical protein